MNLISAEEIKNSIFTSGIAVADVVEYAAHRNFHNTFKALFLQTISVIIRMRLSFICMLLAMLKSLQQLVDYGNRDYTRVYRSVLPI